MDAEWRPADAAPRPPTFPSWSGPDTTAPLVGAAGAGYESTVEVPSAGTLLREFIALLARIEVDFIRRWDASLLGDAPPAGARRHARGTRRRRNA